MKIRTDFVTNSSSSCFCVTLTLQFDNDKTKTLHASTYDLDGDGDYFDKCGRAGGSELVKWNLINNFERIANARNDMNDLFNVLNSMFDKEGKNNAYAVWDAEKLTRADLTIHSCVEGEYTFKADTYELLGLPRKNKKASFEEELDRLKEKNGGRYTDNALETIVLYEDADCDAYYKDRGRSRGIRYGNRDLSKSISLHMRQDGKLDAEISYGKKYSPGSWPVRRSAWVIDKDKLNELKRKKQEWEQNRIADKKEKLSQEIKECIEKTGIRVNAGILDSLVKAGTDYFDYDPSEEYIIDKFRELTSYVKEAYEQFPLEGRILHCPKNSTKISMLAPAVECLGGYLTDEIRTADCDCYVIADDAPEAIIAAYANCKHVEKILLSDLITQILHAEPIPQETAAKRCAEAKEKVSRKLDSLEEKELSILIGRIDDNLNCLANIPSAEETKVTISAEPDGYSIREALERGKKIQIRDRIFDIHSRDENTFFTFLSKIRAVCPKWDYSPQDYRELERLIERAGGAMAQHVRKEQKFADYHVQHEFTTEPESWYASEGQPYYGIPAIGLLSLLEALRNAPAVPSPERKSFQELASMKEKTMQAKEEEKERKQKEERDEIARIEMVHFEQVIEELIQLNHERPFRALAEIKNSKAVEQICSKHSFISFSRIEKLIKEQKNATAGEYLKTIGVLSPENKKKYAEKQKELSDACYEECIRFIHKKYEGREYLRSFGKFKESFLDKPGVLEAIMNEICKENKEFKKTINWKCLEIEHKEIVSNPLTWKGFEDYIREKYHETVEQHMIQD